MLTYIKESIHELRNSVSLPPKTESSNLMVIVAVFSILFALATWGVDSVFGRLIKFYFNNVLN
jgi:preprotein translocase subunit SecE